MFFVPQFHQQTPQSPWKCESCSVFWCGKQHCFNCGELGRSGWVSVTNPMTVKFFEDGTTEVFPPLT